MQVFEVKTFLAKNSRYKRMTVGVYGCSGMSDGNGGDEVKKVVCVCVCVYG